MNDQKLGNLIKECRDEMLAYSIDESDYQLLHLTRSGVVWGVEFENGGGQLVLFHDIYVDDDFHILQCKVMLR